MSDTPRTFRCADLGCAAHSHTYDPALHVLRATGPGVTVILHLARPA